MFTVVEIHHTHSGRASQRGSEGGRGMMLELVSSPFPAEPPEPQFPICEMESLDLS